jgi:hypothetical protein
LAGDFDALGLALGVADGVALGLAGWVGVRLADAKVAAVVSATGGVVDPAGLLQAIRRVTPAAAATRVLRII